MNDSEEILEEAEPAIYSPFWPVLAVFISLLVLQALYVIGDFNEHAQVKRSRIELAPVVAQAQKISVMAENMGKDLMALANEKNAEAAKIVSDFSIKSNQSSNPPPPSPAE